MHDGSKTCFAKFQNYILFIWGGVLFSFQIWGCFNIIFSSLNEQRNSGCIETFSLKLCCAFFLFLFLGGPVFLLILHLCNFRHRCHDFKREIKNYKRLQRYIGKDFETPTQPLLRTFSLNLIRGEITSIQSYSSTLLCNISLLFGSWNISSTWATNYSYPCSTLVWLRLREIWFVFVTHTSEAPFSTFKFVFLRERGADASKRVIKASAPNPRSISITSRLRSWGMLRQQRTNRQFFLLQIFHNSFCGDYYHYFQLHLCRFPLFQIWFSPLLYLMFYFVTLWDS